VTIIPKNTAIPCRVSKIFPTAKADQRSVKVMVVEGESHRPEECIMLGECVVRDLPPGLPKGAHVHVEYSYAANGRISVSARVPQAHQSARVEIVHNQERDLEDLDTWRARLRGDDVPAGSVFASSGPVDVTDRTSVLRRLDALYIEVGKAAVKEQLPSSLARSQQTAQASAAELDRARTALAQAEQAKQTSAGRSEAVRFGSELARAKTAFEQAQTQSDFAYLVLGRDCIAAHHTPSQTAPAIAEIQRLKPHVATG
jgi:molecular chaperone DnaK (HSP70)